MGITFDATPDIDNARVTIQADGGIAGDRFYMLRRDENGTNLIRETSEIGAMWLPNLSAVRTNQARNPSFESVSATQATTRTNLLSNPTFETNTTGLTASYGTTGAGAISRVTSGGVDNAAYARLQWTTASTVADGYADLASVGSLAVGPASISVYVRVNRLAQYLRLTLAGTASTGATGIVNASVNVPSGGAWVRLTWTGTITTPGTFNIRVNAVTPGRVWAIGDQLDVDHFLAEQRAVIDTYFDGSTIAAGDFTYAWLGTAHASSSIQRGLVPDLGTSSSAAGISSTGWGLNGTKSARVIPTTTSTDSYFAPEGDAGAMRFGMVAGKTYTVSATARLTAMQTGTLISLARRVVVRTRVGAGSYISTSSNQAANAAGVTRLSVTITIPSDVTEASVRLYSGASLDGGDVWWDSLLVEETATLQDYFDGTTGPNHVWTGTANASTSTNGDASLPIQLSDYEARQGMETDYILTDEDGLSAGSVRITIPRWGSWIKDPFRPFMNVKVLWNSDSAYTRPVERAILQARGAKFPVVQHDRRMAPSGTVRVATEERVAAKNLIAMLDQTNVVMIDVDSDFGVPVRYVSVGDITGLRVGAEDRDLKWEARYWDLPIQEVAIPIGAPIAQSLTYDNLAAAFGSYVAIPASVLTYNDVALGNWGQ